MQYESPITSSKKVMDIFKSRSNYKVKVTRSKFKVPSESSCHKQYYNTHVQYESSISSGKKVTAKVIVFIHAHTPMQIGHQGYDISSLDIRACSLKSKLGKGQRT